MISKERKSVLAQDIIENPIWDEVYDDMKKDLFDEFCSNIDLKSRERISMAMDLINDLRVKIEAKMVEGIQLKIVGDNDGN